jgi:GTP-binding protein HflX
VLDVSTNPFCPKQPALIEKIKFHYTADEPEKGLIVAVLRPSQTDRQTREYLDELAFLATTSNITCLGTITQRLDRPETRGYVGKGKLEEVLNFITVYGCDCVIFDDDLTPSQVRFLEDYLKIKVLDRSLLILNIFSMRAQTAQSKAQVELAQYQYMYPRLTRMWTHLSKQRGGGAGMRGPGEQELETDRRIVKDRISLLKERLAHMERQSITRRKNRDRLVRVALVGYTNVGKSTLMNRLTGSEVLAENKLFATVDSTVRKASIADIPYLLTDTVGFIRKLPTHLIEAFKSTLDEVREADILLHIVDASSPNHQEQMEVVATILQELGAADKPTIYVFNKIDAIPVIEANDPNLDFDSLPDTHEQLTAHLLSTDAHSRLLPEANPGLPSLPSHARVDTVRISALKEEGLLELKQKLYNLVKPEHLMIYPNYLQQVVL